jgi:hypothetical protein
MQTLPYMGGYPQRVVGPSTTQPTLFGVLGMFRDDEKFQALQQVVERPSHFHLPPLYSGREEHCNTDRHLLGAPAKTHIPGIHHGMVPFAGRFMSNHGNIEIYHGHKEHHQKEHHEEHHKKEHHKKEHK